MWYGRTELTPPNQSTQTTNRNNWVLACIDTNENQICDFFEIKRL